MDANAVFEWIVLVLVSILHFESDFAMPSVSCLYNVTKS